MKKQNYLTGIIGGILGGFIASIPWILMYVYGNMILSLLAIIIAIGVLKGYQLFKGKVSKGLPIIIVVISLLCVTVSTLLIIPMLLLQKEGFDMSFDKLNILYNNDEFMSAMIKDYAISVIFTFLGISGVVANVKKQINSGAKENIKATIKENQQDNHSNQEKEDTQKENQDKTEDNKKTK